MKIIDLENNFFGRKSILDLLKRRVIDVKEGYRQNIAFLGNKHIGKTSILRQFMHDLDGSDVVEVYLDLENKDFDYFFAQFAGSILYHFSKSTNLPLHDDINLLLETTKRVIPQTVESIKKAQAYYNKGKLLEAYRELIALPEIFTFESGKFCILIIDEFHHLEEMNIPNVFQELGKKIMTQKKCLYLVTSSLEGVAKKILSEKLSLLFGNFEIVNIHPFDPKSSQEFVERNLGEIKISTTLRNFLIDFSGGHPFYLSIICQELNTLSVIHKQTEIFLPLLTQGIENTIFNRWGLLSRHFELTVNQLCSGKTNKVTASLLIALANGKHKLAEIISDTGFKKVFVLPRLNRLVELGIVTKNGNLFHFQDKLLRYWVKYVFQRRLKAVDYRCERQKQQFFDEISRLVIDFQDDSRKDLSSRIVELFHCFDNEALSLNGRKYKLPLFREITPIVSEGAATGFHVIKALAQEETWFVILKEDMLHEGDVNAFLAQSKKLTERPDKKVIISLTDLDSNARLKALQEKMWIWNEDELNLLFSLYDKHYIVR